MMGEESSWVAIKGKRYKLLEGENKGLSFTLVERVGSGNAGEVWSVDSSDGSPMALKVFKTPLSAEPRDPKQKKRQEIARQQFDTESSFSTYLPCFVPAIASGRITKARSAIAFPLVDPSDDLDSFISVRGGNEELDLGKRLELVFEILCGIYGLHQEGWLHNDIKAKNILYCPEERLPIRIIDLQFGVKLNEVKERYGDQKTHLGTMGYVAPELYAAGASAVSVSSDIWSLGCTIYHVITGIELHDRDPRIGPMDAEQRKQFIDICKADMDEPIRSRDQLMDEGIPEPICGPLSRMLTPKQSLRTSELILETLVEVQKLTGQEIENIGGVHPRVVASGTDDAGGKFIAPPREVELDHLALNPSPLGDSEVIRVMIWPTGKPRQFVMCRKGETKYVISHHFDGEKFENRKLMSMKWDGEGLVCSGRPYVTIEGETLRKRILGPDSVVVFNGLPTRIIYQSTNP
jgi:serine/threonine protein kinase